MTLSSACYPNRVTNRQRGSATLETVLSLSVVGTIVTGGLSVIYLSFAYVWLERASYEGVICLSTTASTRFCEERLRFETQTALPVGSVSDLHMDRTRAKASVNLRFSIFGKDVLEHRDTRDLPLYAEQTHGV